VKTIAGVYQQAILHRKPAIASQPEIFLSAICITNMMD